MRDGSDSHHVPERPHKTASQALAQVLRQQWKLARERPEMRGAFSRSLGQLVPYSETIQPIVEEISMGRAVVQMADRPEVRNHLNSIHAVALMNLAELTSGLVILFSLPDNSRSIILGLSIRFLKKARGMITADCRWNPPADLQKSEQTLEVVLSDNVGDTVARAQANWLISPSLESPQ